MIHSIKQSIRQILPYVLAISIFIMINSTIYNYLLNLQQEKEKLMLTGYLNSVSNLLTQDLITASNDSNYNKTFFLFKNFSTNNKTPIQSTGQEEVFNNIEIKPYAIHIKNLSKEYIFDSQELRENLNKIFPVFVGYVVIINDHNIAVKKRAIMTQ